MLRIVILALAVCMASACKELRWAKFKNTYNKTYKGDEEHYGRGFLNYNLGKIDEHNKLYKKGHKSYFLKENKMLDMEYRSMQYLNKYGFRLNKTVFPENDDFSLCKGFLNPSVDWRKDGYVTRVKDQGACGSSWAFSATGAIEGQLFKQTGKLVELSESNLVDCSSNWGNQGCKNGSMDQAFQYVIDNKGINTDSSYPYVDKEGPCKFNSSDVGAKVKSVKEVESGSEDSLMAAVATVGPVSAAIDARGLGFTFYGGGVYDEPDCSYTELNHAVLVVGYGTQDGKDYWIVKNSWGEDYGLDGYILMSRNKENQCGIATAASYPVM